jgi:CubicO group peptidase (beta-lactamase class C family)
MTELQKQVQAVVDELVDSGAERGVQAAVYRNGELLVDAVAGVADPGTGRAMMSDTPVFVTSTGKGVVATVFAVLAERGAISYDTRIAELWPEFGAHGKDKVTVRDALTHSVGTPGLPAELTPDAYLDWDGMCALIAGAKPWWEPGTRTGYHAVTFGWITGEIVRRATGKRISEVLRDEVAEPLGVGRELFFGVPAVELSRLAVLEDAPFDPSAFSEESAGEGAASIPEDDHDGWVWAPPATMPDAAYGNRADLMQADIPAGCTATARALAKMYSALLHETDGVRLVSPERVREITTEYASGTDAVFGMPVRRGLGFALGGVGGPLESESLFGMAGSGGTAAYADSGTGLALAVTKNRNSFGDYTTYNKIAGALT